MEIKLTEKQIKQLIEGTVKQMEEALDSEISKLKDKFDKDVNELKEKHQSDIEELKSTYREGKFEVKLKKEKLVKKKMKDDDFIPYFEAGKTNEIIANETGYKESYIAIVRGRLGKKEQAQQ